MVVSKNLATRRAFLFLAAVGASMVTGVGSQAATVAEASDYVRQLVAAALNILKMNVSEADRERFFTQLLFQNFDIPRISRFVLGRYWTSASEEDRRHLAFT